jgi:hypothetical protein
MLVAHLPHLYHTSTTPLLAVPPRTQNTAGTTSSRPPHPPPRGRPRNDARAPPPVCADTDCSSSVCEDYERVGVSTARQRGHLARLVRLDATRAAQLDANLYDQSRWTRAAENSLPSDDNAAVNGHNRPDQSSRAGCRASVIDPSLTLSSLAQTSLLASSSCTPLFSPTPCRALPPLPTCPARPSPPARAGRASCCYKSMRAGSLGAGAAAGPRP